MATAAQILANQQNAQSSTGPRTEAGKARSAMNAIRHGITSQLTVLPSEDVALYESFTHAWHSDFEPHGTLETQLVQTLADTQWRLNRLRAHETNICALSHCQPLPDELASESHQVRAALAEAEIVRTQTAAFNSLSMREQRLHKLFVSTLNQLTAHQNARKALAATQIEKAIILVNHHKAQQIPFDPQKFGFVLSNDDIARSLWSTRALREAEKHHAERLNRPKSAA